jgi:NCAIR mutase (PurE)-related protein
MDMHESLRALLAAVQTGELDLETGLARLRDLSLLELGHTRIDMRRELRNGFPEVIYAEGKTPGQVAEIFSRLAGRGPVLATRVSGETAASVQAACPGARHNPLSRTLTLGEDDVPLGEGEIGIITAGTSDLPVAEEALTTCRMFGHRAFLVNDVGVAGLHRLLDQMPVIRRARVLIVAAGMEGALASVVGGLVRQPVVAVPTSVGYGAALAGFTALCGMLTSCASGISVVNIDNGFGAACAACRINNLCRSVQAGEA